MTSALAAGQAVRPAFLAGQTARLAGLPYSANPHGDDDRLTEWADGWDAADDDARAHQLWPTGLDDPYAHDSDDNRFAHFCSRQGIPNDSRRTPPYAVTLMRQAAAVRPERNAIGLVSMAAQVAADRQAAALIDRAKALVRQAGTLDVLGRRAA